MSIGVTIPSLPFDDSVSMLVGSSPNAASLKGNGKINQVTKYLPCCIKGGKVISNGKKHRIKLYSQKGVRCNSVQGIILPVSLNVLLKSTGFNSMRNLTNLLSTHDLFKVFLFIPKQRGALLTSGATRFQIFINKHEVPHLDSA